MGLASLKLVLAGMIRLKFGGKFKLVECLGLQRLGRGTFSQACHGVARDSSSGYFKRARYCIQVFPNKRTTRYVATQ